MPYRYSLSTVFWFVASSLIFTAADAGTLTVLNNANSGAGSLRDTIAAATAGETIEFSVALSGQTITLQQPIAIAINLTINGLGADQLTVDGNNSSQLFQVTSGANVAFSGLTFTNGNATSGGAISVSGNSQLTVTDTFFTGNFANNSGGAINNNGSMVTVIRSTLSGNTTPSLGGAINNTGGGFLSISNSTLSNNMSTGFDGGAITNLGGMLELVNSTVINNFADNFAGGIGNNVPSTIVNISNSIVAGNTTGTGSGREIGNLASVAAINSGGGNIIGVIQGGGQGNTDGAFTGALGDQFGTVAAPLDPQLAGLADNGGPTPTHLPLEGSPAIDQGDNDGVSATDQRGLSRIFNGMVDVGSVEIQAAIDPDVVFTSGFEG